MATLTQPITESTYKLQQSPHQKNPFYNSGEKVWYTITSAIYYSCTCLWKYSVVAMHVFGSVLPADRVCMVQRLQQLCNYVTSQCSLTQLSKYYSLISFYDCFSTAPVVTNSFSVNETTARPILLNNITCAGTETRLTDCPHGGVGIHNCTHTQDVAVSCPGAYH